MMVGRRENTPETFGELPDEGALAWTITRALLAANDSASHALELHLLQSQYHDDGDDSTATKQYIDTAIEYHERIIEDLRLAREGLDYSDTR
ncbi:hypothetical protein GJR96_07195 [Haloferax sp. MBLA0076]|uniref:DUF8103 domain-containing protein n=1 Tax=Haloferax litoreum TaxID=2666140 RepID=A0A6A8GJ50_9EURY|nr:MULTISPECIES: hypothetical protein [Haloferax]KAB1193241.1 hypothetical protein Hfx1148_07190 [Haloferax sp. CBA1148]MRX21740.1 hypothetical protein [Haloferax litoreum]